MRTMPAKVELSSELAEAANQLGQGDSKRALKTVNRVFEQLKKQRDLTGLRTLANSLEEAGKSIPEEHRKRHGELLYAVRQNVKFLEHAEARAEEQHAEARAEKQQAKARAEEQHAKARAEDPLGQAVSELEQERRAYWTRVATCEVALDRSQSEYQRRLNAAGAAVRHAEEPRRIAQFKNLTLFDTQVQVASYAHPLTADTLARVDQQGMVQSVQGWVFKSNQDRREAYLHIEGQGWFHVLRQKVPMRFEQTWSKDVRKLFEQMRSFASALNAAAKNVENVRAQRRMASEASRGELERVKADSADLESKRHALEEARAETADLLELRDTVLALLERVPESSHVSAARKAISAVDKEARPLDLKGIVKGGPSRMRKEIDHRAERLKLDMRSRLPGRVQAILSTTPSIPQPLEPVTDREKPSLIALDDPDTSAQRESQPDQHEPAARIRELGKLRDEGVLSEEEFETKKAELLRRI
jgi:hypothetical protein